jgi:hypothetical protein
MLAVDSTIISALDDYGRKDHWSQTPVGFVELNVRLRAKTAKAFDAIRPI